MSEEHMVSCLSSLPWPEGDEPSLLIRVTDKFHKKFWLLIIASPDATLRDLDLFIRDVWVECCGHLSDFSIGRVHFCSDGADEDMDVYIMDVLQPGDDSLYKYDFGSTTTLRVTVLRAVPIIPPDTEIVLLGQNSKAHHVCHDCKEEADYAYRENQTAKTEYFCSCCLESRGIDDEYCSYLANSPRAGVCGCDKSDIDGLPWHPFAEIRKKKHPRKRKQPVRRYNREDLYAPIRTPLESLLMQMKGSTTDNTGNRKIRKKAVDPFPKSIPDSIAPRYFKIRELCLDFCTKQLSELEMEKPVVDLLSLIARIPFTMELLIRGTESDWASGFIYAIGQMKGLFTRGREKGLKSYDIGNYFGVKGDVAKGRAYLIRTELRKVKRSWEEEYEGTIFDGQVDDNWVQLMNEWVGDGWYGMRQPPW